MTYTGNYLKPGPSTPAKGRHVAFHSAATTQIYAADNLLEGFDEAAADTWLLFKPRGQIIRLEEPLHGPLIVAEKATQSYELVLSKAGATLPRRDAVDRRIVRQVRESGGGLIDTPQDVGGWPLYQDAGAVPDQN